ncbi:MFS transporter [Sphingomonas sp.]|uniref:MFS transporter n=1 Tax=Sphingomonas sp. TaxID=28214 RepID=UPI00286E69F2|nr:MFS transporter [Sphingomonas sp.]
MATLATPRGSARWLVPMLAAAVLLTYIDRGAVGIAAPLMKEELALSATGFGIAVSAFFWVYVPVMLLVGWLCDRICVYRLFAAGVLLWALSTMATAWIGGLAMLVVLRVLLGLGESIAFPGSSKIIAAEVPSDRRGMANALIAAAIAFGPAVGTLIGGILLELYGWRSIFLVFGLATLVWLLPWHIISRPYRGARLAAATPPFPMRRLFTKPALWWSGAAHFCSNYAFYFALAWLPLYLVKSRGLSILDMTTLTTAVFVVQGISALAFGHLSDRLVRQGRDEGRVRKALMAGAQTVVALCILGAALAESTMVLGAWLVLAGAATGIISTNIFAVAQIFAGPRASGSWVGAQNAIGNTSGIIGPIITGVTIDATGSYFAGFALAAGVAGAGALIWLFAMPRVEPLALD